MLSLKDRQELAIDLLTMQYESKVASIDYTVEMHNEFKVLSCNLDDVVVQDIETGETLTLSLDQINALG